MGNGGKGDLQRPTQVDDKTFSDNWERTFTGARLGADTDSKPVNDSSILSAPANCEASNGNAGKPTYEPLACSAAPSCSQGQNSQVQGEGQRLIYVDDATGKEVDESWWPGDPT